MIQFAVKYVIDLFAVSPDRPFTFFKILQIKTFSQQCFTWTRGFFIGIKFKVNLKELKLFGMTSIYNWFISWSFLSFFEYSCSIASRDFPFVSGTTNITKIKLTTVIVANNQYTPWDPIAAWNVKKWMILNMAMAKNANFKDLESWNII